MFKELIDTLRNQYSQQQQPSVEYDFGEEEGEYTFDENKFNKAESKILLGIISRYFPSEMEKNNLFLELSHFQVEKIPEDQLKELLNVIDTNLGEYYTKLNGKHWKKDKIEEMKENGLIYIVIRDSNTRSIVGFMSLKLVFDNETLVAYLYEIQILQAYTGLKIGAELMKHFHQLPNLVNNGSIEEVDNNEKIEEQDRINFIQDYGKVEGCSLTVFTGNVRALKFYENLGYIKADHSPRDKHLRGRIIKPDYYVLFNFV